MQDWTVSLVNDAGDTRSVTVRADGLLAAYRAATEGSWTPYAADPASAADDGTRVTPAPATEDPS